MAAADEARTIFVNGLEPADVALLRDIAEQAADTAIKRAFTAMGLDPAAPLKAQRDFNFLRDLVHDDELKEDMSYLRRSRLRAEGASGKAINTAIGLAVLGALHAIWSYATWFANGFPHRP